MPDFEDYVDEEPYPEDSEVDVDRCGDPECDECYPVEPVTFNPEFLTATASPGGITFTQSNGTTFDFIPEEEGENMPENPEVTPDENDPVRSVPVPDDLAGMRGVSFYTVGGNRIQTTENVVPGNIFQMAFWDMTPDSIRLGYTRLKEWCAENEFWITTIHNEYFSEGDFEIHAPYYFALVEPSTRGAIDPAEYFSQPDCACGAELNYPSVHCDECDGNTYCSSCREFRSEARWDDHQGSYCDQCGRRCDTCGEIYHGSYRRCSSCHPSVRCSGCRQLIYINDEGANHHRIENSGISQTYCDNCYHHVCHTCGIIVERENIIVDGDTQTCVSCISRNSNEEWDELSELENAELAIPTIPGREVIRMVGVEIEGANGEGMIDHDGGNTLARALYDNGLSSNHSMGGYHSSSRHSLVHVERDSSVDWEMVVGPLNVAEPNHVDVLNRSVKIVRGFVNSKTLKLDMRAGLHIHVEAAKVPFHNAYNLHKLYMYMEDFLYRFGAAKWPYHRSINRRGRDQAGKSPVTDTKLMFARTFTGNRYYGLSFDNYFARYFENCACNARQYGLFDECTCNLGKCTFEFRLFNTTANTVKLHAYLAMCQALVAKAIEMNEIEDASKYPTLDFIKSRASDLRPSELKKLNREWEKRIVFVNEELPLTPEEKKSIHYCIMNSEMGKTVTNADILIETEDI